MACLTVVAACSPCLLLSHAADGFLDPPRATTQSPFPSPSYLLVLRQGGIRDDLITMAAERGVKGWFDPPLAIFRELPRWLGSTGRRPLGDFERIALLTTILRRAGRHGFPGARSPHEHADAVDQLFGEMVLEGIAPPQLERAFAAPVGRDDFERRRDDDLHRAYEAYTRMLHEHGCRDGRDDLADCAAAVRQGGDHLAAALRGRREIRFFGLADLRGGWKTLLHALVQSPHLDQVTIYTSHHLELGSQLEAERIVLEEPGTVASGLFPATRERRGVVRVIAAPDAERELGEVARRVRELVDHGTPPERIAIVFRQARPSMDMVIRYLEWFGMAATARRRTAYAEIPVVRAVLALFAAAAEGWTRHGLAEVADLPFFANTLDARIVNFLGFRRKLEGLDAWARAINQLEREAERRRSADDERARCPRRGCPSDDGQLSLFDAASPPSTERRHSTAWEGSWTPPLGRVRRARRGFHAFSEQARAISNTQALGSWLAWLARFLEDDPWKIEAQIYDIPKERFDLARMDLAGWRGLTAIVVEWREAIDRWGGADELLTPAAFESRLREVLNCDVAHWTVTHHGVRVLEGLAAAYRTFDHVFVVGLEAGRFPLRRPPSPILDHRERTRLAEAGLPLDPRAEWDVRERELFRAVVAGGAKAVTLSYARQDDLGREVIRSAFVDATYDVATVEETVLPASDILTPGLPLYDEPDALAHAARVARIEVARESTCEPTPYNGLIEDPELREWLGERFGDERVWSATQIEEYAKCPWAYFSKRLLHLERFEEPNEDMDHLVRGSVLHAALKRFYDAARQRVGEPVFLSQLDMAWADPLMSAALDAALSEAERRTWIGHPALRGAKREELRRMLIRYLRFEIDNNEQIENKRRNNAFIVRTGVAEHELTFDDDRPAVLERHGVLFRFRGSIDRVEENIDPRLPDAPYVAAVDYKTTASTVPAGGDASGWKDGVVLQLPLYAHALTQLKPGHQVSRVEYRAVKSREICHPLELVRVDTALGVATPQPEARAKMEDALDAVAAHVRRVRAGAFPAAPAPSCGCPPYCHAWEICRVKGGPRAKRER